MPPEDVVAPAGGSNNSSDFVRKLHKMLEDPAYRSIVRWGNEGDSFVVLENEKFTKMILPKHFKHSNFASFVRQLNKYDFHKVRHNEENGQSPYGPGAWEFKHPGFRVDSKHNLDNIRRKAPAPRKPQASDDGFPANQQVALMNDTLMATQHQVQQLQEQYFQLTQTNKVLIEEVVSLQKMVKAQNQVHNELINHLSNVDERRRSSRHSAHSSHSGHSGSYHGGGHNVLPDGADEPAPELRRAREILGGIAPDQEADRQLHRLSVAYQAGSPPDSSTSSSMMFPQPNNNTAPIPPPPALMQDPFNDPRHLVYPVGQTTGIDPFHSDHINNIPYSRPLSNPNSMTEAPPQITPPPAKEQEGSLWGGRQPRILLVEDDRTCARIGTKFLKQIDCSVDIAREGSEAVNKVNADPNKFDLIFMDIIMPLFDGVSATACIRLVAPRVPIVAMTSNIRQEDIATYFHWGMNDVLAKPFTKDGMVRILKKHLESMLRDPPPPESATDDMGQNGIPVQGGPPPAYAGLSLAGQGLMAGPGGVKYESGNTPLQSPATSSSWHSPSQMPQPSPSIETAGGYMTARPMVMTPTGLQPSSGFPGTPPIPRMPDGMQQSGMQQGGGMPGADERPEKRQRMYAPNQGYQ
ncbi:Transcription factor prr1 [Pleurostoma richardsiae]|uniref:Transcription factor n=1 Tax=Pleurostoma richardsiae TaxID=41990 RepID=A0AA38VEK2_9PEZI|nr:Transcription factor prr1 [Pleurostoma richardsiae]